MIWQTIENLKRSLSFGQDPNILSGYNKIPEGLKNEWVELVYGNTDSFEDSHLDRLIKILADPELNVPSQEKSRKTLIQLKALAETMDQLERNTNFLLHQVLNGKIDKSVIESLHQFMSDSGPKEDSFPFQSPPSH